MKRSFLHALALCFVVGFSAGIFLIIAGNALAGAPVALICLLIVASLLKAASRAPERSRVLRLAGWIAGIIIGLALLAAIIIL